MFEVRSRKSEDGKNASHFPTYNFQPPTSKGGFTLVELLVTTSLMALVGSTLVAVLGAGFRVWARTSAYGTYEQSALIAYEQMRRDLHNVRSTSLIPFEGSYDEFSFASVGRLGENDGLPQEIGRIHYFIERYNNRLCRSFVPYRLIRQLRSQEPCQTVFEKVERVQFKFFANGEQTGQKNSSSRWEDEAAPTAVEVSVVTNNGKYGSSRHFFVVDIPPTKVLSKEKES